jgi:Tfp pilus assembly protein PilV
VRVDSRSVTRPYARPGHGEAGFVVLSTLVKTVLAVALVGMIGYDAFSVATTHLRVREQAQSAARAGYETYKNRPTPQAAFASVVAYARSQGYTVVPDSFSVTDERHTVEVSLERTAPTLLLKYIPGLSDYTLASGTGSVSDPLL